MTDRMISRQHMRSLFDDFDDAWRTWDLNRWANTKTRADRRAIGEAQERAAFHRMAEAHGQLAMALSMLSGGGK